MIKLSSRFSKGVIILEIILLLYFLSWHFRLGATRYFDADEVTHLHWGYSLLIGERPYTDFFYIFPPFFLYPIALIMAIFGRSITAVVQARAFIFIVFLLTTGVVFLLGRKLRNNHAGLLSALIFAFLPIPFDKMIEVRPDLIATMLAMLGLLFFIKGREKEGKTDRTNKTNMENKWYFFSGLSYAASLGFVPKTVFFLMPPLLVLVYQFYRHIKPGSRFRYLLFRSKSGAIPSFISGISIPALFLLFLLFSYDQPLFGLYSMTKIASDVTATLGRKFYMRPDIFFYPNDTYYGIPGISQPLIVNLIIYIFACLMAIFRFISSLSYLDRKKCQREFLISASFWINLLAFVYLYPLKHAQYLIFIAPFIALYFADLLDTLFITTEVSHFPSFRTRYGLIRILPLIVFLIYIFYIGERMNQRKIKLTNTSTYEKIATILSQVPAGTSIFDLTGETVFFPNGYYFCCLPYGQYQEALVFKLPDLKKELNKRNTKYIHTGGGDRLNVLPSMQAKYIRENFEVIGSGFMVRKDLQ